MTAGIVAVGFGAAGSSSAKAELNATTCKTKTAKTKGEILPLMDRLLNHREMMSDE
jgi:hypothetical protein